MTKLSLRKLRLTGAVLSTVSLGACASAKSPASGIRWVDRYDRDALRACTRVGLIENQQPGDVPRRALEVKAQALGGNTLVKTDTLEWGPYVEVWSCPGQAVSEKPPNP